MSQQTIQALRALVALADIDLGESALQLAERLDAVTAARRAQHDCDAHLTALRAVSERLTRPGQPVNAVAMSWVARQAIAGLDAIEAARETESQASEALDQQRQTLHALQNRHDGLARMLGEARAARMAERELRVSQEREDLYLARRPMARRQA